MESQQYVTITVERLRELEEIEATWLQTEADGVYADEQVRQALEQLRESKGTQG